MDFLKGNIVQLNELSQSDLAIVCKLFGALFYYQPKDFERLPISTYFDHDDVETPIKEVSQALNAFKFTEDLVLQEQYEKFFTMQEEMLAPPWSSMYLDKESILFGQASKDYCDFVEHCGLGLREGASDPEDHIGLMLMVLGMLIEDEQEQHIKEMVGEYLATWSPFYFARLKEVAGDTAYAQLSQHVTSLLDVIRKRYSAQVLIKSNYFQSVE